MRALVTNASQPPKVGSNNPLFLYEESREPEILAVNACLQLVGTLFFVARVYSRIGLTKTWKWEDTLLAIAWVSYLEKEKSTILQEY